MDDERLAGLAGALRAAERDALARLPSEPWLHAKRALAEHAEEDGLAAAAIEALLGLPATPPGAGAAAPPPARIAAEARALAATTTDPGRLGLLLGLAAAQERHADELPAPGWRPAPATVPARDPFVLHEPGAEPDPIDDAITEAERAAAAGDAAAAADHLRRAAELDRARTEAGDPWGARPIPRRD